MNNYVEEVTNVNCAVLSSQIFYWITCVSGIVVNGLLFIIIHFNTTRFLEHYSLILKLSCIVDIYSSISQFLTQSRPFIIQGYLTFGLDGIAPKYLSKTYLFAGNRLPYILIPEFIGCYYSVCFCVIPFIYRYMIICRGRKMKNIELAACMFVLFVLVGIGSFSVCHAASGSYNINVYQLPKVDPGCTRFVPQFSEIYNKQNAKEYYIYFQIFFNSGMLIILTFVIVLLCAIKIHFFLSRQVNLNTVQRNIQRQVSYTLMIQALGPLLSYYLPTIIMLTLELLGIAPDFMMNHFFDLYAIIPILNPSASLLLIVPYRVALLSSFARIIGGVCKVIGIDKNISVAPFNGQTTSQQQRATASVHY